ncbi:uncharacterized protein Dwil_GK25348 [Drosophila willistoni]|uniref:MADF domain-containing protein n=1 Tax=Drosophila willistoni TaxID=7260 RepID=B4NE57_DROWI|nr:uncharacterized protein Dwil_GK25348 [Drosophila willistoni]
MSTPERKRYHKDNAPTDDILTLINLVRQNPTLYNYKLQPNQRRRSDILSGWQDVAQQIGNKYTVQEVRRKWKNLRDTYHQYRLRTPKCIEGRLSKWRYAKELEFLSTVYQPKLKSHRTQSSSYETLASSVGHPAPIGTMLQLKQHTADDKDEVVDDDGLSSHHGTSQITLVSDEAETFILSAYEESVADEHHHHHHHHHHQHQQQQHHHHTHQHHPHQPHHHHHHHQTQHDGSISSIELSHIVHGDDDDVVDDDVDDVDDDDGGHQVVDIVKHELDEDGGAVAEVDYEEVCLYEEASGAHVDCEMGGVSVSDGVDGDGSDVADSKGFHYIDTHDFCISDIETQTVAVKHHVGYAGAATNSVLAGGTAVADGKLKNLTLVTTTTTANAGASTGASGNNSSSSSSSVVTGTQHIALVDVTEATSTSVTISSTPAISLNAATVTTTPAAAAALCNTTSFTTPTATILQLPSLSCGSSAGGGGGGGGGSSGTGTPLTVSSSLKDDDHPHHHSQHQQQHLHQHQQHQHQQMAQALALSKRDELDLFFDFLKKKMQCFSKTQITHIQMEFLNCVSRQEAADQDAKD